ncbi:MAG: hypothetical protein K0S12_1619 [Bacteroidetes bacterium]|nr:hypothetical protein [Bacteroidota bacterium]
MKIRISFLNKLVIFCFLLIAARYIKTDHYSFLFLFWNLFLAWLPVFFIRRIGQGSGKFRRYCLLGLSILFLPNAPYILTDLFHLKKSLIAPLWFDLILILSFAFLGLIYFIMAFDRILEEFSFQFGKQVICFVKPLLFLATGYGIYLGRYLRFNSWDLVSDPVHLAGGMINSIFSRENFMETFGVTITFTVFLYLIYEIYLSFRNKTVHNELH